MNAARAAAVRLAVDAGQLTLKYFRTKDFQVERKSDKSPVTIARQRSQQHIRRQLQLLYPGDTSWEKNWRRRRQSEYRWIIDPIDGTKSFICGVPLYSTWSG